MPPAPTGPRMAPQDDLYTLMVIVATVLLLFGIVFIAIRSTQVLGTVLPVGGV